MPDPVILPTTFNEDNNSVALFNVVYPETLKVDMKVGGLLKLINVGDLILH